MVPEIFRFRKELNVKKILLIVLIIVVIIAIVFLGIMISKKNTGENQNINANTSKVYYDKDKTVSINLNKGLNKKYKFKQYNSINDYLIELRSENNIGVFISKKELIEGRDLFQVVEADCRNYVDQFTNSTNSTTPQEFQTVLSPKAYTYSLQYLEKSNNTPYYLQVTWLELEDCYYVIDIEMPYSILQETPEEGSTVLMDILSNIDIIQ